MSEDRMSEAIEGRALPQGWERAAIGTVARLNTHKQSLQELDDELTITFVPMAAVDGIAGSIIHPEERKLKGVRKGYTLFTEGDVLFAKITPCMENGKAAIARDLINGIGLGSTEFHVLSPEQGILANWLFYFVRQVAFRNDAKS